MSTSFLNRHNSKRFICYKKRKKFDPLLINLLKGINEYKADHSSEASEHIGNAIDQGANSLENLYFSENPFSLAARYGLSELVELMILTNVDSQQAYSAEMLRFPNSTQIGYAATSLHVAVTNTQLQVVKKLLGRTECSFNQNHTISPLHLAALNQNIFIERRMHSLCIRFYYGQKDFEGESLSNFNFDGAKE